MKIIILTVLTFLLFAFTYPATSRAQTDIVPVQSIAWSPINDLIAVAPGAYFSDDEHDYSVKIFDASTGDLVQSLDSHLGFVSSVAWSTNGQRLITTGGLDNGAYVWDANTWEILALSQPLSMPSRIADVWGPGDNMVANISESIDGISFWDPATGQEISYLSTEEIGEPTAIDWNTNSNHLATANRGAVVAIWDVAAGSLVRQLSGHTNSITSVAWSRRGEYIASAGYDQTIHVWDSASGETLGVLTGHTDVITDLAWEPGGSRFASSSLDGTIRVWDIDQMSQVEIIPFDGKAFTVDWSPVGDRLAFGGQSPSEPFKFEIVTLGYDLVSPENIQIVYDYTAILVDTIPNRQIATVDLNGTNRHILTDEHTSRDCPIWSPDGRQIAYSAPDDGSQAIFVINTDGTNERQITFGPANDYAPDWSPDGNFIVFQRVSRLGEGYSYEIFMSDLRTGVEVNISQNSDYDGQPVFSRDGTEILFNSTRETSSGIHIMYVDGSNVRPLPLPTNMWGTNARWSPVGDQILFYGREEEDDFSELFVINLDGSGLQQITDGILDHADHQWLPDGSGIVYNFLRWMYWVPLDDPLSEPRTFLADATGNSGLGFGGMGCFDLYVPPSVSRP